MKRTIKFRAWDKKEKEMVFFGLDEAVESASWGEVWETNNQPENYLSNIMQFTGLTDKNGKEIYEGDIVSREYGEKSEVKYGCQEVDAFEGIGFNLWSFIGKYGKFNCKRLESEIEVIGNIYEHPELLK